VKRLFILQHPSLNGYGVAYKQVLEMFLFFKRRNLIFLSYCEEVRCFWNDPKYLFQPQANATVSSGEPTIMGENIAAENICFPFEVIIT
jgi:hypothetical protein